MTDHLIVIPVFDEAGTIADVVARARQHGPVLVVDDGSTDGSAAAAAAAGAEVLSLPRRCGKGEALRRGIAAALARDARRVVTMDGDGQHDADDLPRLLRAAAAAPDAVVIGGRLSGGEGIIPPGRLAALRVASFFISWLAGAPVADSQSGFRVYPAPLLAALPPRRGGFVLESEVLLRAAAAGWRLVEVPVSAIHFRGRRSRFRPVADGLAIGGYLAGWVIRRWAEEACVAAAALVRPFTRQRMRVRHREAADFAAPHAHSFPNWALAIGAFVLHRTVDSWRGWWGHPRARAMRLAALASAAAPAVLLLSAINPLLVWLAGRDWLTPFTRRIYSHERLARILAPGSGAARAAAAAPPDYDVLVVGAGPAGATAATLLARGGLTVALVEREPFPRFHVGESLLPANLPLLDRLGVLDRIRAHGFIVKYGANFHDQATGLEYTFYFREGKPWPDHAFEVPRADFDQILLAMAKQEPRVTLMQPARAEDVVLDMDGVTARIGQDGEARQVRARFLVDASGRDAFLATRRGRRRPIPGLGKVALFAHFRGGRRWSGKEEGVIRISVFDDGWFWWIPFAGDVTSVGCVLHARAVRGRDGSLEALFDAMVARCARVREWLEGAQRITPVHSAANFSYRVDPVVGDRFLCVGDAVAFVDPIFSSGVFIAMQTAELASRDILRAFREDRFEASRFKRYERRVRRGMSPFFRFIRYYYEPAFLDIFLQPRETLGMLDTVTGVLAGGAFLRMPWRMRFSLAAFFAVVTVNRWVRRRRGLPVESRLEW